MHRKILWSCRLHDDKLKSLDVYVKILLSYKVARNASNIVSSGIAQERIPHCGSSRRRPFVTHSPRVSVSITSFGPFLFSLFLSLFLPLGFARSDEYNSDVLVRGTRYLAAKDPLEQNLQNGLGQAKPTYSASTPSHLAAIPTFLTSGLFQPP